MLPKLIFEFTLYRDFDYPALVGDLLSRYAAEAIGLASKDKKFIGSTVEESYKFLLQNGVWFHETPEIKCELLWAHGKILVRFSDMASPWSEGLLRQNLASHILPANKITDTNIKVFNLGLRGRQMHLSLPINSTKQPYSETKADIPSKQVKIIYRLLRPEEAHEMVSCLYTAYGYTYGVPDVYSHEDTALLMEKGQIVILAAETECGEIAGVTTLRKRSADAEIFDLCQTAVKPKFKGNRIFENLLRGVLETAENDLVAQGASATIPNRHLVSQDRLETAGFVPVGIFLGICEAAFLPSQIGPFAQERESFLSVYKPLNAVDFGSLFVPSHHQAILAHLCKETGIESDLYVVDPISAGRGRTKIQTAEVANMKAGFVEIHSAGEDIVDRVYDALVDFKQRQFCTVHLYLDLSDPTAMACCERLEAMGFFFASFFPDERPWLILQYLNNVPVLFDELLYPFTGAKQIQYHIERVYRLVQLREKGEFVSTSEILAFPEIAQLPQQLSEQSKLQGRISG
ncbi:MAG: hypothetical protein AAGD96_32100 [Chloroflexota bacterium]